MIAAMAQFDEHRKKLADQDSSLANGEV